MINVMKKIYSKLIAVLAVVAMTTMFSSCDKFGNTDGPALTRA